MKLSTPPALPDTLLDDLKGTPTADLSLATKKAGHFTKEDDENHRRGLKGQNRETLAILRVDDHYGFRDAGTCKVVKPGKRAF